MSSQTNWLVSARWGVMVHYLALPPSEANTRSEVSVGDWNRRVESFNVDRFASELADIGAGYVIFTIGQISGHYCSPNTTYDAIVGRKPSKLSDRDLIADCAVALATAKIKLVLCHNLILG